MANLSPQFPVRLQDGRFVFSNPERFKKYVTSNFKDQQDLLLSIAPIKKNRSLRQNRYYWLILGVIAEDTGHSPEELHVLFKSLFLPKKFIRYKDKDIEISASTATLTTDQFAEYLDRIIADAESMGIKIPIPEEL